MIITATYINSDFVLRDNGQLEKLIKDWLFNPLIFTLLRAPVPRDKKKKSHATPRVTGGILFHEIFSLISTFPRKD